MKFLIIAPIMIPFFTAVVALFFWRSRIVQRIVGVAGSAALLISALALLDETRSGTILVEQIGDWPAPFGIVLVADLFSAIMVVMTGLMGLSVSVYSLAGIDKKRESYGYHPLMQVLLMGVSGSFLTGDIFNLYVWFEVMLIASFVLMELGGERAQLEGAIKYVTLNLVSSALFLTAVGILYGMVGALNMADLAVRLKEVSSDGLITTIAILFLLAFGIKAAVFPLFFWLPASYHTPPAPVSAIFAALLTKVGVYALIRVFTLLFVHNTVVTHNFILVLAGLTMVTGVLGAMAQFEFRRILSFHIISQIGYMIMGLGLYTPLALAGSIYYIIHNIIAKTNLFLVSGVVNRLRGTYELERLGGLYRRFPFLAILYAVSAFSLAGLPPLSGFWAKFGLVKAGLERESYVIVAVALIVGLLTLFSMTKIWSEAFWKADPGSDEGEESDQSGGDRKGIPLLSERMLFMAPIFALALLTVLIGLAAEPLFTLFKQAAGQLIDPQLYIRSVLGGMS